MSKRPPRPENMPWLTPSLTVRDAAASIDFYERAFGFGRGLTVPGPDGKPQHAEMTYKGAVVLMMSPEGAFGNPMKAPASTGQDLPTGFYVYCDDVDALYAQATRAGATGVTPPADMFWGDRMCSLKDRDGYSWHFATNVADFDPSKMPK